jgi:leucyl/phenylalanyl-tRNA--protein transferase
MAGLPDGLVSVGGDLSPERLIATYRRGIFPWYEDGQPVLWWCPDPRTVFDGCRVHVSRSLQRTLKRGDFTCTMDTAFEQVIDACAAPRMPVGGTWITTEMRAAYCELHRRGHAHSLEVWRDGALVGGLYGVALGRVFFGESMFSRETDASKVALVTLAVQLRECGFTMIDAQLPNPHLDRMGAIAMPRTTFLERIAQEAAEPDLKLIKTGK